MSQTVPVPLNAPSKLCMWLVTNLISNIAGLEKSYWWQWNLYSVGTRKEMHPVYLVKWWMLGEASNHKNQVKIGTSNTMHVTLENRYKIMIIMMSICIYIYMYSTGYWEIHQIASLFIIWKSNGNQWKNLFYASGFSIMPSNVFLEILLSREI